jgi:hypothetical protein
MDDKPSNPPLRPHSDATWSEIIGVVTTHGGSIEQTKTGYALVRVVGTMLLHFPLPIRFDPSQPDKVGRPSPLTLDSIQRNLDVRLPYYFVL